MQKTLLTIAATIAISTTAHAGGYGTTAHNNTVIQKAPTWDNRITDIYVMDGNTAVIKGNWPASYRTKRWDGVKVANVAADGWCGEFDKTVQFLYIVDRANNKLGGVMCK